MARPAIEVLGVYNLRVTDRLFRQQFGILYGSELPEGEHVAAERQCREQLESTVLVEVIVHNPDKRFDVGHFVQPRDGVPRENWQTAWAEAYLSIDGTSLAVRPRELPPSGDLRLAFYVHYWMSGKPLASSYGDIICPAPTAMPERLEKLVPYEPVD